MLNPSKQLLHMGFNLISLDYHRLCSMAHLLCLRDW